MSFVLGPVSSAGGDDVVILYVDFSTWCGTADITTLHGVTQVTGSTLNITSAAINTSDVTVGQYTATADKSVKFTVTPTDGTAGNILVRVEVTKTGGDRQTFQGTVKTAVGI